MIDSQRRALFWILLAAAAALALWRLSDILLPFVMGMAIAYFFDPVVDWFERRRVPRPLATVIVIVLFAAVLTTLVVLMVPLFERQILDLAKRLPALGSQATVRLDILSQRLQREAGVPEEQIQTIQQAVGERSADALNWLLGNVGHVLSSGLAVVNVLSLLVVTPVVAFYMLRDWDRMVARVDSWLPRGSTDTIRAQMREIDRTLSGFARGQALVCIILALLYGVGLSVAGLQSGFVVGVIIGALTFIPYVGTIGGAILSVGLAMLQFPDWVSVGEVALVFVIGHALEGNVLQPLLVGDRVGLHPVWVIFALLAGGSLFGFIGLLLAIPVASVIGVMARFALQQYLAGSFYGAAPPARAQAARERDPVP
ncbi:MAG TPA: AI-2E family transporter [Candidatus Sulfotelmatobacter sp.]|nr:AI-2E family transporter [Candidatus Sulfotelmatobacter sp.]